jgi:SRSO17 transposase
MQQFMSEGSWDDTATLHRHWQEVDRDLGEDDGVRLLDGSDFLKQGCESVGVKRRYCGELGKQANCQAGVFLGYASRKGYTLLDRRLYSPQELVTEAAYVERRRRCGAPEEITLTTKPRLGLERRRAIRQASPLRCRWVIGDEAFGRATDRPDRIAEIGLWSFAEVPHDTRVWPQRPAIGLSPGRGRAPPPTHVRLEEGEAEPATVVQLAAMLPRKCWRRRTIKAGSQGPLVARLSRLQVIAVREGLPGPAVWLMLCYHARTGELKTYLGNAPAQTSLATLVRLSLARCFLVRLRLR